MHYDTLGSGSNNGFAMLQGLPIVLALVIGGVGFVAGALFAGIFGLATVLIQENWHLDLWMTLVYLAPGLAVLGIIQNPAGAVVAIGEGFARCCPGARTRRREAAELKAANAEPEVGELGLEREFEEADVLLVDRGLGISNDAAPHDRPDGLTMPLLDIDEVSVQFGGLLAVDGATLSVRGRLRHGAHRAERRGQDDAVQRHHGSAGTDAGRVLLDDRDITRRRPYRRARLGIARTFQRLEAFGSLTARENVLVALEMRRRWAKSALRQRRARRRAARAGRDRVGRATSASSRLPTGTARLVEVARALATDPKVLAARRAVVGARRSRDRRARRAAARADRRRSRCAARRARHAVGDGYVRDDPRARLRTRASRRGHRTRSRRTRRCSGRTSAPRRPRHEQPAARFRARSTPR